MSIRFKIALLFTLLVVLLLALVNLTVYLFSMKDRQDTFRTRLRNRALSTATVYASVRSTNYSVLRRMDTAAVASLYNKSITVVGYNDSHEYMFSDKPGDSMYLDPDLIEKTKIEKIHYYNYRNKKAVSVHYMDSDNNFIVAVAASDVDGRGFLSQLKRIQFFALGLAAILSFLTGLLFAKDLIRPLTRITREVNLITSRNLSHRIQLGNTKDELARLGQTFNNLLDRLEESFAIQRRFISNASHELSTPLTSVSSQLEVALQRSRTPEEYREVMQSMNEDIRELQQLTRSLLEIAKTGSQGSIDLEEVRLDEVLFKVLSDVQKQNQGFRTELEIAMLPEDERRLSVFGNDNLLYMAMKNVVENGCKYSDDHLSRVSVDFGESMISISVANKGDVIAESDIQSIFQPFFRTDSAQSKPGFGLGLTLTRRILSLHKGTIHVESNPQTGTIFTMELPHLLAGN